MESEASSICYADPNLAIIGAFFGKFGKMCGVNFPSISDLVTWLTTEGTTPHDLAFLHLQLLRRVRRSATLDKWERAAVKFCQTYSFEDAKELEETGYLKCSVTLKLRLLKNLLEYQFDCNAKFKAAVNLLTCEELRPKPTGSDKSGCAYYAQVDSSGHLRVYRESPEGDDRWSVVAHDRVSLVKLLHELIGDDTTDLSPIVDSNPKDATILDTGQNSDEDEDETGDEEVVNLSEGAEQESDVEKEDKAPEKCEKGKADDLPEETKKSKVAEGQEDEDDVDTEVDEEFECSEEIEEPPLIVTGEGNGADCDAINILRPNVMDGDSEAFECSEEIEEAVFYVYGNGAGADCDTGNPDQAPENDEGEATVSTSASESTVPEVSTSTAETPCTSGDYADSTVSAEGVSDSTCTQTSESAVNSTCDVVTTSEQDTPTTTSDPSHTSEIESDGVSTTGQLEGGTFTPSNEIVESSDSSKHIRVWSISDICGSSDKDACEPSSSKPSTSHENTFGNFAMDIVLDNTCVKQDADSNTCMRAYSGNSEATAVTSSARAMGECPEECTPAVEDSIKTDEPDGDLVNEVSSLESADENPEPIDTLVTEPISDSNVLSEVPDNTEDSNISNVNNPSVAKAEEEIPKSDTSETCEEHLLCDSMEKNSDDVSEIKDDVPVESVSLNCDKNDPSVAAEDAKNIILGNEELDDKPDESIPSEKLGSMNESVKGNDLDVPPESNENIDLEVKEIIDKDEKKTIESDSIHNELESDVTNHEVKIEITSAPDPPILNVTPAKEVEVPSLEDLEKSSDIAKQGTSIADPAFCAKSDDLPTVQNDNCTLLTVPEIIVTPNTPTDPEVTHSPTDVEGEREVDNVSKIAEEVVRKKTEIQITECSKSIPENSQVSDNSTTSPRVEPESTISSSSSDEASKRLSPSPSPSPVQVDSVISESAPLSGATNTTKQSESNIISENISSLLPEKDDAVKELAGDDVKALKQPEVIPVDTEETDNVVSSSRDKEICNATELKSSTTDELSISDEIPQNSIEETSTKSEEKEGSKQNVGIADKLAKLADSKDVDGMKQVKSSTTEVSENIEEAPSLPSKKDDPKSKKKSSSYDGIGQDPVKLTPVDSLSLAEEKSEEECNSTVKAAVEEESCLRKDTVNVEPDTEPEKESSSAKTAKEKESSISQSSDNPDENLALPEEESKEKSNATVRVEKESCLRKDIVKVKPDTVPETESSSVKAEEEEKRHISKDIVNPDENLNVPEKESTSGKEAEQKESCISKETVNPDENLTLPEKESPSIKTPVEKESRIRKDAVKIKPTDCLSVPHQELGNVKAAVKKESRIRKDAVKAKPSEKESPSEKTIGEKEGSARNDNINVKSDETPTLPEKESASVKTKVKKEDPAVDSVKKRNREVTGKSDKGKVDITAEDADESNVVQADNEKINPTVEAGDGENKQSISQTDSSPTNDAKEVEKINPTVETVNEEEVKCDGIDGVVEDEDKNKMTNDTVKAKKDLVRSSSRIESSAAKNKAKEEKVHTSAETADVKGARRKRGYLPPETPPERKSLRNRNRSSTEVVEAPITTQKADAEKKPKIQSKPIINKAEKLEVPSKSVVVELEKLELDPLATCEVPPAEVKRSKSKKKKASKKSSKKKSKTNESAKTEQNKIDKPAEDESLNEKEKDEVEEPSVDEKTKEKPVRTKYDRKYQIAAREMKLLNLDIGALIEVDDSSVRSVRQSRRIAQIKLKEDAERRREEELQLQAIKEKGKKSKKKPTVEDTDYKQGDEEKEKGKKKKKFNFNENNPWVSSSESSEQEEEYEEDEIEEEPEEHVLKSDHEFSPESELEDDPEYQPTQQVRTARARLTQSTDQYADTSCENCASCDRPEEILLCDKCDKGWHLDCVKPIFHVVPEGQWFCPNCNHEELIDALKQVLREYDRCEKQRENEELRKKRLAFVGISLDNVLPARKQKKEQLVEDDSSEAESSTSASSRSRSSSGSEPIYQLRERRSNVTSYRYNEYDELIRSAIQDEMEQNPMKNEEAEEETDRKELSSVPSVINKSNVNGNPDTSAVVATDKANPNSEEQEDDEYMGETEEDEPLDEVPPVVPRHREALKKKKKKLTSLEFSSEEDRNSDSDFKGSISEHFESEEELSGSDSSEGWGRKKRRAAVRRSTRARTRRFDKDFINDDTSDDEDSPKHKRREFDSSESSDSDRSWGARKGRRNKRKRQPSLSPIRRSSKKKKKLKRVEGSENEAPPRKRKIKYGGLNSDSDDKVLNRRTRGKKINYVEELGGSDSEEEKPKKKKRLGILESDEEFVADENKVEEDEEEDEEDPAFNEDTEESEDSEATQPMRSKKGKSPAKKGTSKSGGARNNKRKIVSDSEEDDDLEDLDDDEEEKLMEMLEKGDVPVEELKAAVKKAKEEKKKTRLSESSPPPVTNPQPTEPEEKPKKRNVKITPTRAELQAAKDKQKQDEEEGLVGSPTKNDEPITPTVDTSSEASPLSNVQSNPLRSMEQLSMSPGSPTSSQRLTMKSLGPNTPAHSGQPQLLQTQLQQASPLHRPNLPQMPTPGKISPINRFPSPNQPTGLPPLAQPSQWRQQSPLNAPRHLGPPTQGSPQTNPFQGPAPQAIPKANSPSPLPPTPSGAHPPRPFLSGQPQENVSPGPPSGVQPNFHPQARADSPGSFPPNPRSQASPIPNVQTGPYSPNPPRPMAPQHPQSPSAPHQQQNPYPPPGMHLPFPNSNPNFTPANEPVKQRRKPGPKPGSKNRKKMEDDNQTTPTKGRGRGRKVEEVTIATVQAPTQFPDAVPPDGGSVITRMLNSPQGARTMPESNPRFSGPSVYHQSHPMDPSPSGGAAVSIAKTFPPERFPQQYPNFQPYPNYQDEQPQQQPTPHNFPVHTFTDPPSFPSAQVTQPASSEKPFDEEDEGEFGGLASYFASRAEEDMDT